MKQEINIENYEAFYLDYLEGNLSNELEASLLAFLEENPSLISDDDLLDVRLTEPAATMDASWKNTLKIDLSSEAITTANVETFLIASVEQQLDPKQEAELATFLAQHPVWFNEYQRFQQTRFQPDFSLQYPDKHTLKKGATRIIPLYVRYAAVAAGLALIFTVTQWLSIQSGAKAPTYARQDTPKPLADTNRVAPKPMQGVHDAPTKQPQIASVPAQETEGSETRNPLRVRRAAINQLRTKKACPLPNGSLMREPIQAVPVFAAEYSSAQSEIAMIGYEEMKNPIKPVTAKISEIIKQEVDFRTSKAARKRPGGFYLKIGKLEISRKVSTADRVASK